MLDVPCVGERVIACHRNNFVDDQLHDGHRPAHLDAVCLYAPVRVRDNAFARKERIDSFAHLGAAQQFEKVLRTVLFILAEKVLQFLQDAFDFVIPLFILVGQLG